MRFFGDDYLLEPTAREPVTYQLERRAQNASAVTDVSADGHNLSFKEEDNRIRFEIRASAPVAVRIGRRVGQTNHAPIAKNLHDARVALRRVLSELRDRTSANGDRAMTLMLSLLRRKAQAVGDKNDR